MNIVEKLLNTSNEAMNYKKKALFYSQRLSEIFGENVEIEIEEIPYRQASEIYSNIAKKNGTVDTVKKVDADLRICLAGIKNLDFKNQELKEKFGCATPKDLAEKILGNEVLPITEKILDLSGYTDEKDEEDEIKN